MWKNAAQSSVPDARRATTRLAAAHGCPLAMRRCDSDSAQAHRTVQFSPPQNQPASLPRGAADLPAQTQCNNHSPSCLHPQSACAQEDSRYCDLSCSCCPNKDYRHPKELMDLSSFKTICVEYKRMGGGALGLSSSQSDVLSDSLLNDKVK